MSSISSQKASSSSSFSSSTPRRKYDVFLSFRGEDTRTSFADHLYFALKKRGIATFRDEENLEIGKSISPELLKAIKESSFAIVILSRNFASSTWCLDELTKIIEQMKETAVWPIFYKVDPSDVRKQTGTFVEAFFKHEERFKDDIEKVQTWKAALEKVANLKGWHLQDGSEAQLIQVIVRELWHKLNYAFFEDIGDLVGIESQVNELESCLAIGSNDVRIIGVWGMGAIGKTTLARVVFSRVWKEFDDCCFLHNVREVCEKEGLLPLQQQLIRNILNESIQDVDEGVFVIKNRLHHKRILLVLDDVSQLEQLEKLAGNRNWFGSGSRVIITTRNMRLLHMLEVNKIYEAKGLSDDEALRLLSLKAFKKDRPPEDYLQLSKDVVQYTKGLPLAIKILGSLFFKRSINHCKSILLRLKEFPEPEILQVLKISYDELHETEKKIFKFIACFFNHEDKNRVEGKLDYLGLYPGAGLDVLVEKSLIKIEYFRVWMHDLLQDMARKIIHDECPEEPGKRSILWSFEDINSVLTNNTGTGTIQGIVLNLPESKEADWNPESFSKMHNLKLLIIRNVQLLHEPKHLPISLRFLEWKGYPSKSLPLNFQSNQLVELYMCGSYIEQLWKRVKSFEKLQIIQMNGSTNLKETPDLLRVPNLKEMVLEYCLKLREIHPSTLVHNRLTLLNLQGCVNVKTLPSKFEMESLEVLNLSGCSKLKKIPEFGENMQRVLELHLGETAITELPTSIGHLTGLVLLNIRDCKSLACLPDNINQLCKLATIYLSNCTSLRSLPKLPVDIVQIFGDGCTSLETVRDLQKPNSSCKGVFYLTNCCKLADNQDFIDSFLAVIRKHHQGFSRRIYADIFNWRYDIFIPGSVIPKWFIYQSIGAEVNIKELSSHLCDNWMGIAVCVVLSSFLKFPPSCNFIANGKVMSTGISTALMLDGSFPDGLLSDHIWLFYLLPQFFEEEDIKLLNECEANELSQFGIEIEALDARKEVKKCGFRMIYKKDIEELNRTMVQSCNTNIIPCEDLDVPHHNFKNSAVVAEGKKAKQICDDYDGAGPSGEGSSNDMPLPKRIERLAEFMPHGDSDC